jgi:nitrate reductase gamma subunit
MLKSAARVCAGRCALIDFNSFLQKSWVDDGGIIIAAVVAIGIIADLLRWRKTLRSSLSSTARPMVSGVARARALAVNLVVDVLYQKPIADCSRVRWLAHLAMFWGFVGLAITTTLDAIVNPTAAPLPLFSPVRLIGNISGIIFMVGLGYSLGRRVIVASVRRGSTAGDILFLAVLFLTGLTGFLTEYLSDLNVIYPDYLIYWSHIVLVAALLLTAPFTKFVHALGRPILFFIRRLGKEGGSDGEAGVGRGGGE